ncbi:Tim10/DDP family zinc finger protein (macronuclear) [Tetrahymena thermophila SB210]|uniref:Tim10/DDP family zinc finger protein n=1 Tax=Tetrahymena thermophila (strain SB210) TaxID=312017 RepID=I7MEQ8_TETTS|nr:Tim10/DDP family zinc finger protein [Tetrahymena thermophila SB210]EAR97387.1 Tim10/DDP family zinc finger protein [Tetrahymena thermophila SB210]|eukprot:XP_001017632.1 Tim10/DDP family zinc finger protein [Tetrahymena thermophila SB210]
MSKKSSSTIELDETITKNLQNNKISYKEYINTSIQVKYMVPCTAKCFVDYQTPLSGVEKACLAKCIDRVADYYAISQSELNPNNKQNQKHMFQAFNLPVKD